MPTVAEVNAAWNVYTPEQASLARSPMPPPERSAHDCRATAGLDLSFGSAQARWRVARFRYRKHERP